jgi:hypothetical protein
VHLSLDGRFLTRVWFFSCGRWVFRPVSLRDDCWLTYIGMTRKGIHLCVLEMDILCSFRILVATTEGFGVIRAQMYVCLSSFAFVSCSILTLMRFCFAF